jgi:hypothetical protein
MIIGVSHTLVTGIALDANLGLDQLARLYLSISLAALQPSNSRWMVGHEWLV